MNSLMGTVVFVVVSEFQGKIDIFFVLFFICLLTLLLTHIILALLAIHIIITRQFIH